MNDATGGPATTTAPGQPDHSRVRYGTKRESQTVPFEWAETILIAFAEEDPVRFGRYLQIAAGLEVRKPGRKPGTDGKPDK